MDAVVFEVEEPASDDARAAMQHYFDELGRRFPSGFDPGDAVDEAATRYRPPTGLFVVARQGDVTVGCGALDFLDDATAEIKRMWIAPQCRGAGVGRRLLRHLEDEARAAGRSTVVLDTNGTLLEAIAMYEAAGYLATGRYNDNPYAERWFTKSLP